MNNESADHQRRVLGVQDSEDHRHTVDVQPEHGVFDLVGQFALLGAYRVKAREHCWARGHSAQPRRLVGKAPLAKAFEGFEIILARGEQGRVAQAKCRCRRHRFESGNGGLSWRVG